MVKNQFEFDTYKGLVHELPEGATLEYETEKLVYTTTSTYLPDFVLTKKDGSKIYIEAKGFFDYDAQRKMVAVKTQHPELDIRMILYKDSPLRKGSKLYYSGWCEKNGFPYAIREIPEEWFS